MSFSDTSPQTCEIEKPTPVSVSKRLQERATDFKEKVQLAEEGLKILKDNPDLERLLTILPRIGLY